MSTGIRAEPGAAASLDLESTARLPVLDVAAYEAQFGVEETSAIPVLRQADLPLTPAAPDASPTSAEFDELRAGRDAAEARAAGLLLDVQQETARREAAEARVAALRETVETLRSHIDSEAGERVTLRREADFASLQLSSLRDELERHRERLRDAEGRRGLWEGLLRDAEVARAAEVEAIRAEAAALRAASAAERERLGHLAAELEAGRGARERRETELLAALEAAERRAADGAAELSELAARAQGLQQALDERGNAYALLLSDRDAAVVARDAAVAGRDALLVERDAVAAQRDAFAAQRDAMTAERDALQAELEQAQARIAAMLVAPPVAPPAVPAPGTGADVMQRVQDELRSTGDRVSELETDLRAAEDQINRLEGELRIKSQRLEEAARIAAHAGARADGGERGRRRADDPPPRRRAPPAESADPVAGEGAFPGSVATADGVARYLVLMDGDTEIVHVLGRRTTVGRGPDNDIRIDAKYVSRHHGVVLAGPTQTVVEDLHSTNGVMVNGRRVSRGSLRDGDVVHFGKSQFRFVERVRQR
jgi:hypothetical protein